MSEPPEKTASYWMQSVETPGYPELKDDIEVDVVIIGAGIVGLSVAYMLKKTGLRVAVLEKDKVGSGVSGHTTGKITTQHNMIYAKLQKRLGQDQARIYAQANQLAFEKLVEIIKEEDIDCDFRHEDSYVYTSDPEKVNQFKEEAKVAASFGLPATFETETDLPFSVTASVRFSGQATFHIRKYLLALAEIINGDGSYIFENSHAYGIKDGKQVRVRTPKARVLADKVIVATNVPTFPLMARGTYCIAEYPQQSYIVAGKMTRPIKGMYISPDKEHYSILPVISGNDKYLLVGGEAHIPGTRLNQNTRYKRLADYADKYFGIKQIDYRWSHRDYLGYDDMPLIGKTYPWSRNSYTATGFMKWGMTNGTLAAMILSDLVQGKESSWSQVFTPHRFKVVTSIPKVTGGVISK